MGQVKQAQAMTFLRSWNTSCRPVEVLCSDGNAYVAKGAENERRAVVREHLVGRLGGLIGAPVPEIALIYVPAELVEIEPAMAHVQPGHAHGARTIQGCIDRAEVLYTVGENRARFARLAVLFGWVWGNDLQYLYEKASPHRVWSVDHSEFFPGVVDWDLSIDVPAEPHARVVEPAGLGKGELRSAANRLRNVTDAEIADAVSSPPEDWGFPLADRIETAQYLAARRDTILSKLAG